MNSQGVIDYSFGEETMKPWYQIRTRRGSASVILLAFALLLPVIAVGQTVIVDQPIIVPVNTLSVSDIDFLNATAPKLLFTIGMRTSPAGSTVDASMEIRVIVPAYNPGIEALYIKTRRFTIVSARSITNLDLGRTESEGTTVGPVAIETNRFDPDAKRWLENFALPSGVLPAGSYDFTVNVTPLSGGTSPPPQQFAIVLSNPSAIEPVLPLNGEELMTSFPLFQWRYEGSASLSVFEKLENQGSLEEAASGVALLTTVSPTQSYQYPVVGVRPLLPGKTYVWYVEGLAPTSGGTNLVHKSALRWFSVAAEGGNGAIGLGAGASSLLDELERALGPKYRPLFDQIRAQGLLPESVFRLNGNVITGAELSRLLERFRSNPDVLTSVEFE